LIDPPGLLVSTVNPSRRWVAQVWRLPGNVHAVTPDQKPPVEAHGHRRRRERSLGPPLPLGRDVQMRLAAFAGITDFTDLLTLSEAVPSGDPKRSLPEMAKQDVESVATQKTWLPAGWPSSSFGTRMSGRPSTASTTWPVQGARTGVLKIA
jgi:hypothetical protein